MSWYKFSKDYLNILMDKKDESKFTNGQDVAKNMEILQPAKDPSQINLEDYLSPLRDDVIVDPKIANEAKQPNKYFSHGQGGDYRMQEGRDLPWNSNPDNFTNTSDWNS